MEFHALADHIHRARRWSASGCAFVALIAFVVLMISGCRGGQANAAPTVEIETLPPDLKGMKVFIAESKITGENCIADVDGFVRMKLTGELIHAGYRVTTNRDASDLVATQSGTCGNIRLNVQTRDVVVFEGSLEEGGWVEGVNNVTQALTRQGFRPAAAAGSTTMPPASAEPSVTASLPSRAGAGSGSGAPTSAALRAGQPRPNAYALIIGIEKYRDAPAATGARADATHFAELAKSSLGVPQDHIMLALDERASKADIEGKLQWLAANVPTGGRVYFFFAGHGAPDATSQSPYLFPYDGDLTNVASSGVALATVLSKLGSTKAEAAVAFVDACYSGAGGRSVIAPGTRALTRIVDPPAEAAPRVMLLSSAASTETSGPVGAGNEGLFTHLIVEGLGQGSADVDGDGSISVSEIAAWVKPRVSREAKKASRDQTPTLRVGAQAGDPANVVLVSGMVK